MNENQKGKPFVAAQGQLSAPDWSAAVFAHNESARICGALEALVVAADGFPIAIHVLANGCTDDTEVLVGEFAAQRKQVRLVSIGEADKANAWNHYIHDVAYDASVHFFTDGDVRVAPGSLRRLASALGCSVRANAAGGLPLTGRDAEHLCRRLIASGSLAGGLYALRGPFVDLLRRQSLRIPVGYIGDDWMVATFAQQISMEGASRLGEGVVLVPEAGFSFASLSPMRLADYKTYLRRWYRYRMRWYQSAVLADILRSEGFKGLPTTMDSLAEQTCNLRPLSFGRNLPMDLFVLWSMRRAVARAQQQTENKRRA